MKSRVARIVPLLFASGLTSLIYQVAWMRDLRLVFGFSTAASGAVVAIFLGGLGLGSWLLGRRADEVQRPLYFYGRLELGIAGSAAATPFLIWLVRQLYVAMGGSFVLGFVGGTALRLLLSALVLAVPTVLMGGTLPAASRAVETREDSNRRRLAVLYGANTLGAVAGVTLSTFWLQELLGTRLMLWAACVVNALVALVAMRVGRTWKASESEVAPAEKGSQVSTDSPRPTSGPTTRFVISAAAIVGFAFGLMELVWYRMLAPLLGGSTYTFGLILAVALAGIGVGAAVYGLTRGQRSATLAAFATTCGLEALFLAIPYALGDSLALFAALQRPIGSFGFGGYVWSWAEVTALVVFPAALVSGVQFPLLVGLLGRGDQDVGRHVGQAYAWNTLGAILGSLAGGFGLLPILSAPGTWIAVVLLLALLGARALFLSTRLEGRWLPVIPAAAALAASVGLINATGPTAAWRHSPIGAGRVEFPDATPNALRAWLRDQRRRLQWEAEGVESSVGLFRTSVGYAFAINGKIDGSAVGDAPTQVMGGLVGAALHPGLRRALVVGLGTGSTAGWLAALPTAEQIDVVELEPAVLEVARQCAPVNRNVLANPKIRILIGDARELLLTTRGKYDLIFSEPSNPYRAGISSLFTREFYQAAAARLTPGGRFVQWLQAYEVDAQTVRTTYATLASVFPAVETWFSKKDDLLLAASSDPIRYSLVELRSRLREEPFASAMASAWHVENVEGLLSHYMANDSLSRAVAREEKGSINTDDRNYVEFGFARSLGHASLFQSDDLRRLARARGEDRPVLQGGDLDWSAVERQRLTTLTAEGAAWTLPPEFLGVDQPQQAAHQGYLEGKLGQVRAAWLAAPFEPSGTLEIAMIGEALADGADRRALDYSARLGEIAPAEAEAVRARFLWTQEDWEGCLTATTAAFERYRSDPWALSAVMHRLLAVATELPSRKESLRGRVCELLAAPFAVGLLDEERSLARVAVCRQLEPSKAVEALQPLEPQFPWRLDLLDLRARVYQEAGHPRAGLARGELEAFLSREPVPFSAGLEPPPTAAPPKGAPQLAPDRIPRP
jgi:spermidine synthase